MNIHSGEGVIKFRCVLHTREPEQTPALLDLLGARQQMYRLGLIGYDPEEKVGFGNISCRAGNTFYISASQTGHIPQLSASHIAHVTRVSHEENMLECEGMLPASSESMTHAMLYAVDPDIGAVVHVHHHEMWERGLRELPCTGAEVEYGTLQMADEVRRLLAETSLRNTMLFAMAGHRDGLISFGKNLAEACTVMENYLNGAS